jgi:hypothetical protein
MEWQSLHCHLHQSEDKTRGGTGTFIPAIAHKLQAPVTVKAKLNPQSSGGFKINSTKWWSKANSNRAEVPHLYRSRVYYRTRFDKVRKLFFERANLPSILRDDLLKSIMTAGWTLRMIVVAIMCHVEVHCYAWRDLWKVVNSMFDFLTVVLISHYTTSKIE